MARQDTRGLPISTVSDAAAAHYREGADLMLAAWPGAIEAFEAAIAADPDFALAHAALAYAHRVFAQPAAARSGIERAEALVARSGTERERSHVAALALAIRGDAPAALARVLDHVEAWPRDALILTQPLGAFGMFAFSGRADHNAAGAALCERTAPHYGQDWWFLTCLGWAKLENGDLVAGRRLAEQGFDLRRANADAAHTVVHAMFEDGSGAEADALISDWMPGYDRTGLLHGHIAWHQALIALNEGDAARALALYRAGVRPAVTASMPINVLSDCASFLWRLDLQGQEAPRELWDEVAVYAGKIFPHAGFPFVDVHQALVAAACGDAAAVEARAQALDRKLGEGALPAGPVVPALCRGLLAFAEDDYELCVSALGPVADEVVRIGGSHAQRELVEDTLIQALMRGGELARARAMLGRRLARRPSPRDTAWRASCGGLT